MIYAVKVEQRGAIMRSLFIFVISVFIVWMPASAQLTDILELFEELKAQVETLQETFTTQGDQLSAMTERMDAVVENWNRAQPLLDRIPILDQSMGPLLEQTGDWQNILNQVFATQQQLAPLLQEWPAIQEMISTVTSMQSSFNDQLAAVTQLQQTIQNITQPQTNPRIESMEVQLADFAQIIQAEENTQLRLQQQLDDTQMWLWIALGGLSILLIFHIITWIVFRQRKAATTE
jgi:ABC-type transporter Mla subunit MlaD